MAIGAFVVHQSSSRIVSCNVLTISDTRSVKEDKSGEFILKTLENAGHRILQRELIPDELISIQNSIQKTLSKKESECILITGGTGISIRDVTIEAILPFIEKKLDGFGEIFRALSFKEIGPHAILSRALAGTTKEGILIFALPGSTQAVSLAMKELILPVLSHAVNLSHQP